MLALSFTKRIERCSKLARLSAVMGSRWPENRNQDENQYQNPGLAAHRLLVAGPATPATATATTPRRSRLARDR